MKRSLLLVAAVLIAGLVLLLSRMVGVDEADAANAASPSRMAPAGPVARDVVVERPIEDASTAAPSRASDAVAASTERSSVSSDLTRLRTVRIVDFEGSVPVADALVRWVALADDATARRHPAWDLDLCDAWFEEHGGSTHSGLDGVASFETPSKGACVVTATIAGHFGRALLVEFTERPTDIVLAHDESLRVRTLGPNGAPLAGVPVVLRSHSFGFPTEMLRRESDAAGHVVYAHFGARDDAVRKTNSVAIAGMLDDGAEARFDPQELPVDPIVLHVPLTGSVEVVALPPPGVAVAELGSVDIFEATGEEGEIPSMFARRRRAQAQLVDGRALVPWIALGQELDISVTVANASRPTTVRRRGPSTPGEVVRVEVLVGVDHPILRLRAVDPEGVPFAKTRLEHKLFVAGERRPTGEARSPTTDDDGVFLFDLTNELDAGSNLTLEFEAKHDERRGVGSIELSRSFEPGVIDLGEIVLRPPPVVVAGRVVDSKGRGVAHAQIFVESHSTGKFRDASYARISEEVRSDENGAFSVRALTSAGKLQVRAQLAKDKSNEVECAVGATDIVLELSASATIAGRVLLDEDVPRDTVSIRVKSEDNPKPEDDWNPDFRKLAADGTFNVDALRPGRYTVMVTNNSGGKALATLNAVDAPAGEASADPRLSAIDLRGQLVSIRLELIAPKPSDRVSGSVSVRTLEFNGEWSGPTTSFLHLPSFSTCAAAARVDLVVAVTGFRRVELTDARGVMRVELQRGPAVRLTLPPEVELPQPPRYLKAFLDAPGAAGSMAGHFQEHVFGADRELVVYAPGAGPFEVHWLLESRTENSLSTHSIDVDEPQVLEILDVAGEQTFEVVVPTEQLAQRLQQKD